jgi:hypothetical protein
MTNKSGTKKWSAGVTEHSNAMDLKKNVFKSKDPDNSEIIKTLGRGKNSF